MTRPAHLRSAAVALLLAAVPTLAACGDDDARGGASARTATTKTASTGKSAIPTGLAGTWQATIARSEIADPPAELEQERSVWRLELLATGGEDDGPSLLLSNDQVGEIVHPISLSGDAITLDIDAECKRFSHGGLGRETIQIQSAERDRGCPSTLTSSILQRPWRLVESDRSRRGPTTAEVNLAARDEFVACAQQRDELGLIVGFRDGEAVANTGDGGGGGGGRDFDPGVSAPRAIAATLENVGQYVGLRAGEGPDLDILIYAEEDLDAASLVEEEAGPKAVLGGSGGQNALGQFQSYLTVAVGEAAPRVPKRVQAALNACFERASTAGE